MGNQDSLKKRRTKIEGIQAWDKPFCICLYICPGIVDHDLSLFSAFHLLLLLFEPPTSKNGLDSGKETWMAQDRWWNSKVYVHVPPPLWLFSLFLLPQKPPSQSEMPKNKDHVNIYPKRRRMLRRIKYTGFWQNQHFLKHTHITPQEA